MYNVAGYILVLAVVVSVSLASDAPNGTTPTGNTTEPVYFDCQEKCQEKPLTYKTYNCKLENNTVEKSKFIFKNSCKRKHVFQHYGIRDASYMLVLFTTGAIAAGGGVGGGGVFIPVLILIGGFLPRDAVPLSNSLIAGAAVANWIQMGMKRHPLVNRPLIYYDLALLMSPLALGGTIIGVMLNQMFPDWLTLVLLIMTLIYASYRTGAKGYKLYKRESSATPEQGGHVPLPTEAGDSISDDGKVLELDTDEASGSSARDNSSSSGREDDSSGEELDTPVMKGSIQEAGEDEQPSISSDALDKLYKEEAKTPWLKVGALFVILIVICLYSLVKGAKGGHSILDIKQCSAVFWIVYWCIFPLLFVAAGLIAWMLVRKHKVKVANNYPFPEGDIMWTTKNAFVTCTISIFAGILASLLGIGGGMVLSPVMLELGVLADVTAATGSLMILFTSISAVVQFGVLGRLIWEYGGVFAVIGFATSFVGQTALNWLVRKYNKKSYIVFAIVSIIVGSTVLLAVTGTLHLIDDIKTNHGIGFSKFCP